MESESLYSMWDQDPLCGPPIQYQDNHIICIESKRLQLTNLGDIIAHNNEQAWIDVSVPQEYGFLPIIPYDLLLANTVEVDFEEVEQYLNGLILDRLKVIKINGISLDGGYYNTIKYICGYCETIIDRDYFYCFDCQASMCENCHDLWSQDLNLSTERQTSKPLCSIEHELKPRSLIDYTYVGASCDLGGGSVNTSTRYHDRDNYDICIPCSQTPEGQRIIEARGLELLPKSLPYVICEFGSLMDWIPILKSSVMVTTRDPVSENSETLYCDYILINLNVNSPHYRKFAVCSQFKDHLKYYIYKNSNGDLDSSYSLESLIEDLRQLNSENPINNLICNYEQNNETGSYGNMELFVTTPNS